MQKKKHINCPKIGLIYAEYNCLPLCVWLWHFFLLSVRIIALRRLFPCPSGLFWASHTHTHTHTDIMSVIQLTPSSRCHMVQHLRGQRSLPSCSRASCTFSTRLIICLLLSSFMMIFLEMHKKYFYIKTKVKILS